MPCDFQTFAVDLYEERKANGDEATIRTCISRLYYSIYHAVLRWLQTNNADLLAKFKCGSHERIQFSLQGKLRKYSLMNWLSNYIIYMLDVVLRTTNLIKSKSVNTWS